MSAGLRLDLAGRRRPRAVGARARRAAVPYLALIATTLLAVPRTTGTQTGGRVP